MWILIQYLLFQPLVQRGRWKCLPYLQVSDTAFFIARKTTLEFSQMFHMNTNGSSQNELFFFPVSGRLKPKGTLWNDFNSFPFCREEVDVQGADGHIYKGRMGTKLEARLPSVTQVTEGETTRFWFRVFLVFFLCLWFQRGFTSISKTLFPELRKNAGCLMKSSEYLFYSACQTEVIFCYVFICVH